MIFATCGSSPIPFVRMMEALEALPREHLVVQHGPVSPPPAAEVREFLPFDEMVELIDRADVVVSHAGVGSIMCALQAGHVPIVFPRLKRHHETVDDHQAELAAALAQRGKVVVATNAHELRRAIDSLPARKSPQAARPCNLSAAVRAAIRGEPVYSLPTQLPEPAPPDALQAA